MSQHSQPAHHWSQDVHQLFQKHEIKIVSFIPDGGLTELIHLCVQDLNIQAVTLTTEEEGIALSAGAFLGGNRSALLMQSSGVGNCINMLSLPATCNMPLLTLVTMRGEWGETNPWQVPMGQATPSVLEAMGVVVHHVSATSEIGPTVEAAISLAFNSRQRVAVLISQKIIGTKKF